MLPKPIVAADCELCDLKTMIFEPRFVSVWELDGKWTAVTLCYKCLMPIIENIDEETAKYMYDRGVKIFSWREGRIVWNDEA